MKLFWVSLTIFYVIIHQKYLAINAEDTLENFTGDQRVLIDKFADQIIATLKDANVPEFSLEDDDLPLVQNYTNIDEDQLLDGNLLMYNIIIDSLDEIEDCLNIFYDGREIHMVVNITQLVIDGEFIFETPTDGAEEKKPFSVILTNVRIKGIAYLLVNPYGNFVISKVVPTVFSEESHVSARSETAPSVQILKSALTHLQNTIEKQFAKMALLEVQKYNLKESDQLVAKETLAMFEVRRFVSQRYDPYTFSWEIPGDHLLQLEVHLGPVRLHGFSNIHLSETVMVVTDDSVDILVRMSVNSLHGNSSLSISQQRYDVTVSIPRLELIAKIKLMADNSAAVPIIQNLGMNMTEGCHCHLHNKATGMRLNTSMQGFGPLENALGYNVEEIFCIQMYDKISMSNIKKTIQNEIFNRVDLENFEDSILPVIHNP